MAYDIYPAWSPGPSSDIAQQQYNFAGMNYANQNANIARQQAYDQQDISNRQNYFNEQRAIEAEAARRREQADAEAEQLAFARGESARRNYQFGVEQAFKEKQLQAGINADKLRYGPDATTTAAKADVARLFMGKGEGHGMTDEEIALATGTPLATVSAVATPFRVQFPEKAVDALNNQTQAMRLKNPDRFDMQPTDVIEGLKNKLPPEVRERVSYDPESHSWNLLPPRVKLRNPLGDPVSVAPENAAKAVAGWQRSAAAGAYNFAPTAGTATMPPAAPIPPASPAAPQFGNQGGGYFQPSTPKILTPDIARDYRKRYGTREKAEAAAKADGYTWTP